MISYICEDCKHSSKNVWARVFANNETHEYCCFSCYLRHPTIIPTESKFKSTGNELVILPNLRQCTNENITDDENDEYDDYDNYSDYDENSEYGSEFTNSESDIDDY